MKSLDLLPFAVSLFPALIFYLAYWQYFVFYPDLKNHLIALVGGVFAAALLALIRMQIPEFHQFNSHYVQAFILAALPEKLIIYISIVLFLRSRPIMPGEIVMGASITGLGFALVENFIYSAEWNSILLARTLAVTPLHFTTSGIIGYYFAMILLGKTGKIVGTVKALALAVLLHGLYDLALLSGPERSFYALIPLLIAIIILDFRMAQVRAMPPSDILHALGITFQGWLINQRQFQYERWILKEKANFSPDYEPLFGWRLHRFRLVLGMLLGILPALYYIKNGRIFIELDSNIVLSLFVFLPLALILILLVVGVFNPAYFKHGILRVPAMMRLRFPDNADITKVYAYDLRSYGCFAKTPAPLATNEPVIISLRFGKLDSGPIRCAVVQENHKNIRLPLGSLLVFQEKTWRFYIFLLYNTLERWSSGLSLLLRLPGHSLLKRLFLTPETVARDLRFFPRGTIILHEGKRGQEFFLIRQGEVEIYKTSSEGVETMLARLGAGQIVGEMALAGNVPRNASVRCLQDSILSMADGSDLDSLVRQNPDFARQLLATISTRAFRSGETLDERLGVLEKQISQAGVAMHNILSLALLGSPDVKLDEHTIKAHLVCHTYKELGFDAREVQQLLGCAVRSQNNLPDLPINEHLQKLRIQLRLKQHF
ncbi:MAG: cyclic nucleotide-binding domain-containing protein [Leptospiraceae bacterium]|nr:cyclic nucleotide-binding domain-containing protein [Leptospiraceae bacterium]